MVQLACYYARMETNHFIDTIKSYYRSHKRAFAWRDVENPYYVLVSEIMLQQTQTYRVAPKFEEFIARFPSIEALAQAPLAAVLTAWQGLGYNRRAKFLHLTAQHIVAQHGGVVPADPMALKECPGIGPATAASIVAFSYDKPTLFIETNIRAVFIHFFFPEAEKVSDAELWPLIEATLDREEPRQWYYALMDYGVMLKKVHKNPSRRSKHHVVQSKFEGSRRQVRGAVVRVLTQFARPLVLAELHELVGADIKRHISEKEFVAVLEGLLEEVIICESAAGGYLIAG